MDETVSNWDSELERIIALYGADSGTVHLLGEDGVLHLTAARGIPPVVVDLVRIVPIGKGMAGVAAERNEPVTVCNLQSTTSGDVRPGAKLTGMEGALVVPIRRNGAMIGTLGIAHHVPWTFSDEETERLLALAEAYASQR